MQSALLPCQRDIHIPEEDSRTAPHVQVPLGPRDIHEQRRWLSRQARQVDNPRAPLEEACSLPSRGGAGGAQEEPSPHSEDVSVRLRLVILCLHIEIMPSLCTERQLIYENLKI